MHENVAVGAYVLIQAGGFAFERVEPERAREALDLMQELMLEGGDARSSRLSWIPKVRVSLSQFADLPWGSRPHCSKGWRHYQCRCDLHT